MLSVIQSGVQLCLLSIQSYSVRSQGTSETIDPARRLVLSAHSIRENITESFGIFVLAILYCLVVCLVTSVSDILLIGLVSSIFALVFLGMAMINDFRC